MFWTDTLVSWYVYVFLTKGTFFSKQAVADSSHSETDEYFKMAIQRYRDALTIKPDDYRGI